MKFIRGALFVLLGLTCLIQTGEGIASIADPAGMMRGLNLAMSPGVEVPLPRTWSGAMESGDMNAYADRTVAAFSDVPVPKPGQ